MSERPNCRSTHACKAKTPGKHCPACSLSAKWRDPTFQAAHKRAVSEKFASDADYRARHSAAGARNITAWQRQNPEKVRALASANGRRARTPEVRKAISDAKMAWCPPRYRAEYRDLIKVKRLAGGEARRIIEAEIAAEPKRLIARITAEMHAKEARRKREAY